MHISLPDDTLIPDAELAEDWECTTRTLRRYEHEKDGLPSCTIGGKKYRLVNGSKEWLKRRIYRPNPSRGG